MSNRHQNIECDVTGNALILTRVRYHSIARALVQWALILWVLSVALHPVVPALYPVLLVLIGPGALVGGLLAGGRTKRTPLGELWFEPSEEGAARAESAARELQSTWGESAAFTAALGRIAYDSRDRAMRRMPGTSGGDQQGEFRLRINGTLTSEGPNDRLADVHQEHQHPRGLSSALTASGTSCFPPGLTYRAMTRSTQQFEGPLGPELTVLAAHQQEMSNSEKAQWVSICDAYQQVRDLGALEEDEIGMPENALAARDDALADLRGVCEQIKTGIRQRRTDPARALASYTAERFARNDELSLDSPGDPSPGNAAS